MLSRIEKEKAMITKSQLGKFFIVLSVSFFISQGCARINSASPFSSGAPHTGTPTKAALPNLTGTPTFTLAPKTTLTIVPSGIFALLIYPPLVMNYDVSVWKDESHYAETSSSPVYSVLNYLQSLSLETCQIGIQGPTGDFPFTPEAMQLGVVKYEVITFTDAPPGLNTAYYIENNSLIGFNYEAGASVLVVQASLSEWSECKALAEKVLSTLRIP
ncbi:MAG: hypothetical protein HKUEN02_19430 [Anaerolineaceae bacterium]|nr:MAG: hypothetical protein HKUEN02_19430 [Anaerolineaceae bacterium]